MTNEVPGDHLAHWHATSRLASHVDRDAAVHLLQFHFDPMPIQADFRSLIGRTVKALGKSTGQVGPDQLAVLLRGGHGAVVADLGKNRGQLLGGVGLHLDQGKAGVVPRLADRDLLHPEVAPRRRDQIEHLGQDQTVDDMPGDLHILDNRIRSLGTLNAWHVESLLGIPSWAPFSFPRRWLPPTRSARTSHRNCRACLARKARRRSI